MKILSSLLLLIALCSFNQAQEPMNVSTPKAVGLTFSGLGINDVIRFQTLDGAASYDGNGYYGLGLTYIHPLNNTFVIETGATYLNHSISIIPQVPPGEEEMPTETKIQLLSIPITMRAHLSKYFFLNAGLLLNLDASPLRIIDDQRAIGGLLGAGFTYPISRPVSVFCNPYFKIHSLVSFANSKYPERLIEAGFRFGLTIALTKS